MVHGTAVVRDARALVDFFGGCGGVRRVLGSSGPLAGVGRTRLLLLAARRGGVLVLLGLQRLPHLVGYLALVSSSRKVRSYSLSRELDVGDRFAEFGEAMGAALDKVGGHQLGDGPHCCREDMGWNVGDLLAAPVGASACCELGKGDCLGSPTFATLYVTDDEFAAEIANRTMQGVAVRRPGAGLRHGRPGMRRDCGADAATRCAARSPAALPRSG